MNPKHFPDPEAWARASGAEDVLAAARTEPSLDAAVADCTRVIGTSARQRTLAWPQLDPRECGDVLLQAAGGAPVALVFGRERTGLTNTELDRCSDVVTIPANPDYSSLNLGAAVQVLGYEIRRAALGGNVRDLPEPEAPPATREELERLYSHLEAVLDSREFLDRHNPEHLMRRFRRLYSRAKLDRIEVQILRGMLTALAPDAPREKAPGHRPSNT